MKNSLFIIKDGQHVQMTINDLFNHDKYNKLYAVTYSAGANFVNKYLSGFKHIDLIIGSEPSQSANTVTDVIANQYHDNINTAVNKMPNEWAGYSTAVKQDVADKKFNFYFPVAMRIHDKFYLMTNGEDTRVIIGSANLSTQAFNAHTAQSECILVFNNDKVLFDLLKDHFTQDLMPFVITYFPKIFTGRRDDEPTKADDNDNQLSLFNKKPKVTHKKAKPTIIIDEATSAKAQGETVARINDKMSELANSNVQDVKADIIKPSDIQKGMAKAHDDVPNEKANIKQKSDNHVKVLRVVKVSIKQSKNKPPHFARKNAVKKNVIQIVKRPITALKNSNGEQDDLLPKLPYVKDEPLMRDMTKGTTGFEVEAKDKTLKPLGHKASLQTIKAQITAIDDLINTYIKYPLPANKEDNLYGRKVYEAILYAFNAIFLPEIREHAQDPESVANTLFLGADSYTGKSRLLDCLAQMVNYGVYGHCEPISWGKRFPNSSVQASTTNHVKEICYLEQNAGISPIFYDEISPKVFSNPNYPRQLVIDQIQQTLGTNQTIAPLIGTTNAKYVSFAEEIQRRIKFITMDHNFPDPNKPDESKAYDPQSDKDLNNVLKRLNNKLYLDFIYRMCEKISDPDTDWGVESGVNFDYMHLAREVFEDYYKMLNLPLPIYFPVKPLNGDYEQSGRMMWRDLYLSEKDSFKENEAGVLTVNTAKVIPRISVYSGQHVIGRYRNTLPVTVCVNGNIGKRGNIITLNKYKFLNWIGIDNKKPGLFKRLKRAIKGD